MSARKKEWSEVVGAIVVPSSDGGFMEVPHTPGHGGGPMEDAVLLARLEAGADPPGEYTRRFEATGAEGARVPAAPPSSHRISPRPGRIPSRPTSTRDAGSVATRRTRRSKTADAAPRPSHQNPTNRRDIVRNGIRGHVGRDPNKSSSEAKSGPLEITRDNWSDKPDRSHNPEIAGSNPATATRKNACQGRSARTGPSAAPSGILEGIPKSRYAYSRAWIEA